MTSSFSPDTSAIDVSWVSMGVTMRDEIERFVASLHIPEARKAVVLAELVDHATSAAEAARRAGLDEAAIAAAVRDTLGDLEEMRARYEAVEAGFGVSRRAAFVRGLGAAMIVALALDQGAAVLHALGMGMASARTWSAGIGGAVFALVIGIVFAPPHLLAMLRGELRAPRVRGRLGRGVPIGAAATYLYTVMAAPFVVWIGMIVVRAYGGVTEVDAPLSAFSLTVPVYALLFVEGWRARRAVKVVG